MPASTPVRRFGYRPIRARSSRSATRSPSSSTPRNAACFAVPHPSISIHEEQPRDDAGRQHPHPGQRALDQEGRCQLFLWEKRARQNSPDQGTILFVHGSSMASQPTFDLQVPGRPDSSAMDWFAGAGFDTWCVDMEGYGRSDKHRDINCDIANGADDLEAATDYISRPATHRPAAGVRHLLGRAARRAVRAAPSRARRAAGARRLRLDRRRQPDAGRAHARSCRSSCQEQAPADRPRVRALDLRARPSRHRRRQGHRGVRRRDPRARRLDAERHLRRHVLEPAGRRSRPRSRCRPSSCAASTTASRASTT